MIDDAKLAISFLTRLPITLAEAPPPGALARSMRLFPLVGAAIGAGVGGLYLLALRILPDWPAALLALAAGIVLTGALHEDGLADCADGFGGGRDAESKLAIMRDSRIGSYGALALILSVMLRGAALVGLNHPVAAMAVAHGLSRAALPVTMRLLSPASQTGLAAQAGRPSAGDAAIALLLAVVVSVALLKTPAAVALAAALLAVAAMAGLARRQIGGYSGDVLGAIEQTVEIAVLLAILAFP